MIHHGIHAALARERMNTFLAQAEADRLARPGPSRYGRREYRDEPRVARGKQIAYCLPGRGRMLSMLGFLFRKVLFRLLMAIAVPLALVFARYLARAVLRHAVIKPTAKALRPAESAVTDASRRASDASRRASDKARQLTPVKSRS
jgi:hypothetical protein